MKLVALLFLFFFFFSNKLGPALFYEDPTPHSTPSPTDPDQPLPFCANTAIDRMRQISAHGEPEQDHSWPACGAKEADKQRVRNQLQQQMKELEASVEDYNKHRVDKHDPQSYYAFDAKTGSFYIGAVVTNTVAYWESQNIDWECGQGWEGESLDRMPTDPLAQRYVRPNYIFVWHRCTLDGQELMHVLRPPLIDWRGGPIQKQPEVYINTGRLKLCMYYNASYCTTINDVLAEELAGYEVGQSIADAKMAIESMNE